MKKFQAVLLEIGILLMSSLYVYISEKDQASYGKIDAEKITKEFDADLVQILHQ